MTHTNSIDQGMADAAGDIGEASARFRRIRLALPTQHRFVAAMEALRKGGLAKKQGEGTRGLRTIQPTGSGKSEAVKQLVGFVEGQPGRDPARRPILHVTLSTQGTPRSFAVSCLEAFRLNYSIRGTEEQLLERLRVAIEENGVELLVIDELNHCAGKTLGRDISNTLKNMLTFGWAPIVLIGTEKAQSLFQGNRELKTRCRIENSVRPMDPVADIDLWTAFATGMDIEMKGRKLVSKLTGLDDPELAKGLCVACGGRIGELVNVLDDAMIAMMTDGRRHFRWEDLRDAVQTRFVLEGEIDANPLVELCR